MRLDKYIAKSRIIELKSEGLRGALEELLIVATKRSSGNLNRDELLRQLLEREHTMTTCLGNNVAMPHIRVKMKRPYIFAIGRCLNGLKFEGLPEYEKVQFILLLIGSDSDKNYLNVLASLARMLRDEKMLNNILAAPDTTTFQDRIFKGFRGLLSKPERKQSRFNRLLLQEAEKIARAAKCSSIVIFSDTFAGGIEVTDAFPDYRTIMVTRAASDWQKERNNIEATIEVRSFSNERLSQLRSAVVIGLTRGIFKYNDRLCCLGGLPHSNQFDTLVVVDIEREFQSLLTREADILPGSVKVEVVERMIAIATELSIEGREGRPVGCLFVVGDIKNVNSMIKPLVLTPFYGYKPEDRNVLNPFMDETIKELSSIDGAFIIRGDGVIESAGSLIHAPAEYYLNLPSGFGARHSAAAAITRACDCITLVVSASSGQVTLFRRGVMLPLLEKALVTNR